MTAAVTSLGPDVVPVPKGWRVNRPDGTNWTVLPRHGDGWAVFNGVSTVNEREPALGYPGSWRQHVEAAIDWARTAS